MNSAPPPPKEARTDKNESASHPDGDTVSTTFFLDSFPKEILDNVLRFFSRLPQAKDWVPHIPLDSIIELYGVTGGLGEFMKPRFNTLCISNSFKPYTECGWPCRWKKRKGPMLWTKDLHVARRFVLAGGGQSLHTIIVGRSMYSEDMGIEIVDDFLSHCPNVKSLSIEDKRGDWVSRFGGQLEHLDISTESSAAIAENCTNLRELSLSSDYFASQDDVEIYEVDIWEHIGGNLESLTLTRMHNEVEHIECIKTHCRNLRRIFIFADGRDESQESNQERSDLLASYGDQLEYCYTEWMNESQLTAVSKACTNARFSVRTSGNNLIYSTLKVLGPQLDGFDIRIDRNPLDAGELTNAWNACPNIRELEVSNCNFEYIKAIVATPKKHVKILYISPHYPAAKSELKKVLDLISKGVVGVEKILFSGGPPISGDAFDKLISRNKSSLREFEVISRFWISSDKMDTYLPLLLKCPALELVRSQSISENMLETLGRRGIQSFGVCREPRYA